MSGVNLLPPEQRKRELEEKRLKEEERKKLRIEMTNPKEKKNKPEEEKGGFWYKIKKVLGMVGEKKKIDHSKEKTKDALKEAEKPEETVKEGFSYQSSNNKNISGLVAGKKKEPESAVGGKVEMSNPKKVFYEKEGVDFLHTKKIVLEEDGKSKPDFNAQPIFESGPGHKNKEEDLERGKSYIYEKQKEEVDNKIKTEQVERKQEQQKDIKGEMVSGFDLYKNKKEGKQKKPEKEVKKANVSINLMPETVKAKIELRQKIIIFVLVIGFLIVAGSFGYLYLMENINDKEERFAHLEERIVFVKEDTQEIKKDSKKMNDFVDLIKNVKSLINNHIVSTRIFDFFEENTLKNVYYENLNFTSENSSLSLTGKADSYKTAAEQLLLLQNNKYVRSVEMYSLTAEEEEKKRQKINLDDNNVENINKENETEGSEKENEKIIGFNIKLVFDAEFLRGN